MATRFILHHLSMVTGRAGGRRRRHRPLVGAALASVILGLASASARAEMLAFSTNTAGQLFTPAGTVALPQQNLQFTVSTPSTVEITFSAECSVQGNPSQYISIEILVDGIPVSPTAGTDDGFCSGDTVPGLTSIVTASMTVARRVAAGAHVVAVRATTVGAGQSWLDDLSITVDR